MRGLIAILTLCAGMAHAAPDCAEGSRTPPSEILAVAIPGDFGIASEDEPAKFSTTRGQEVLTSVRPRLRPCRFQKFELGREQMRNRGAVCGDWTIQGTPRKPFTGKYRGCGIANPVQVRKVSDIFLSQLALMDCETAVTFKTWLENTAKPAFADQGGGLKGLRLAGHYSCKTQNNRPRARLSEHARGRAIDISAFVLHDGTIITVGGGWNDENSREVMRELHSGACGLFGTVLGPDADRFHKGHFHFDTARRHSGAVCR